MAINYYYYYHGGGFQETSDSCVIEIHYRFLDGSHTMDAFLQNKCEADILNIIKEVVKSCGIKIIIESEPKGEGGQRFFYRLTGTNTGDGVKSTTLSTLKTAIITAICIAPITTAVNGISEVVKTAVTSVMKDPVRDSLEKEKLINEIKNSKIDLEIKEAKEKRDILEDEVLTLQTKIAEEDLRRKLLQAYSKISVNKKRLGFYQKLANYDKVIGVSVQVYNDVNVVMTPEYAVVREEFKDLVIDKSKQAPMEKDIIDAILPGSSLFYSSPLQILKQEHKKLNKGKDKKK